MGRMIIQDNAIWAKHIEADAEITRRILSLPQNAPLILRIDGKPVRFLKMRNQPSGKPTNGLRPDPEFKAFWDAMQERRGEVVGVSLDDTPPIDPYLASLSVTLSEWDSPEDCAAYDGL